MASSTRIKASAKTSSRAYSKVAPAAKRTKKRPALASKRRADQSRRRPSATATPRTATRRAPQRAAKPAIERAVERRLDHDLPLNGADKTTEAPPMPQNPNGSPADTTLSAEREAEVTAATFMPLEFGLVPLELIARQQAWSVGVMLDTFKLQWRFFDALGHNTR